MSLEVRSLYLLLNIRRARFMSNSMLLKMPKRPFKDSMAVGLVDDKYLQPLSLTLSCKLINRMLKTRFQKISHYKSLFLTQILLIDCFFSLLFSISNQRNMQIFRLLFRAVVLVIARWQAGSTLITFRRFSCLHLNYFFSALDKLEK